MIHNCIIKSKLCLEAQFLCTNYQQQSCKAFIVLSIGLEMIGGRRPFYAKIRLEVTHPLAKRHFQSIFCL